ncbi:MAG TPA: 2-C-methyl-D-erythritol 4-phosphate cytidylyltransferase [Lachnospiraceae bacterium]|nr:2-C-methyl-D-erythritol 4-phosphate cytidylyltransferase [Lachnospiraceae bacterium]
MEKRCTAILLAAGTGRRMESSIAKQYMLLENKPIIWYGLQAFQKCSLINECILVVGKGEINYARDEIVDKFGFSKVSSIIEGGAERYLSVQRALDVIRHGALAASAADGTILIQDGARPFITEKVIQDTILAAEEYGACCAAVPVKDTIRIANEEGLSEETPDRKKVFSIQTPQTFCATLILQAYQKLSERIADLSARDITITDDCMVVEQMLMHPVKLVEASYTNIKITTPEDMAVAKQILQTGKK